MRILISTLVIVWALLPAAAWCQLPPAYCTQWGSYGSGPGQFNDAMGVAVDASGNVYVADTDSLRGLGRSAPSHELRRIEKRS